jgi:hypothetical protein
MRPVIALVIAHGFDESVYVIVIELDFLRLQLNRVARLLVIRWVLIKITK